MNDAEPCRLDDSSDLGFVSSLSHRGMHACRGNDEKGVIDLLQDSCGFRSEGKGLVRRGTCCTQRA